MARPLPPHHPNCMGCGPENPGGLGLRLGVEEDRVVGRVTLDERHQGAPGFAHGGAVATALDDTLGTLLMVERRPAVTAHLEVDYLLPARLGRAFDLEAWIDHVDGRKIHMSARMREGDEVVAQATAVFIEVEPAHFDAGVDQLPY